MYLVNYTKVFQDGRKQVGHHVCFSAIRATSDFSLIYHATTKLKSEYVDFWLDFCSKMLDTTLYQVEKKEEGVDFTINQEIFDGTKKYLLYLTAFRYIQEKAEIVKKLFEHKGRPFNYQFKELQKIHVEKGEVGSGHGLIPNGPLNKKGWTYDPPTIVSFVKFKKNIKAGLASVHSAFKNDKTVSSV